MIFSGSPKGWRRPGYRRRRAVIKACGLCAMLDISAHLQHSQRVLPPARLPRELCLAIACAMSANDPKRALLAQSHEKIRLEASRAGPVESIAS